MQQMLKDEIPNKILFLEYMDTFSTDEEREQVVAGNPTYARYLCELKAEEDKLTKKQYKQSSVLLRVKNQATSSVSMTTQPPSRSWAEAIIKAAKHVEESDT
jgi:hypothetical protein